MFTKRLLSTVIEKTEKQTAIRKITSKIGLASLKAQKYSPEAALILGIGAGIAAAVLGAKAYKKHEEHMQAALDDLAATQDELDDEMADNIINSKQRTRALIPVYGRVVYAGATLYGPTLSMAGLSLYLILFSHRIIRGRNKALIATVQLLEQGFRAYRGRVAEEFGPEVDERLYYGAEQREIKTISVEDGKKKTSSKLEPIIPEDTKLSVYSFIFDQSNPNFVDNRELNEFYLRVVEQYLNTVMEVRGYVLLNDLFEQMGLPRTPVGCISGWSVKAPGDNFIDLGVNMDINKRQGDARFIIDPNCNGVMYDLI